jgi:hypothetical protein
MGLHFYYFWSIEWVFHVNSNLFHGETSLKPLVIPLDRGLSFALLDSPPAMLNLTVGGDDLWKLH